MRSAFVVSSNEPATETLSLVSESRSESTFGGTALPVKCLSQRSPLKHVCKEWVWGSSLRMKFNLRDPITV